MAEATLDSPLTLDPQTCAKLRLVHSTVDHVQRVVIARYDLVDSNGVVLQQRTVRLTGAAVNTWITNNENTLYTRLLAQLGVTGTVA